MADANTVENETELEDERAVQLHQLRLKDAMDAEKSVQGAAQRIAGKLNQLIAQGHDTTAFSIALLLAALKDGVDIGLDFLFLAGEIPLVGQLPGVFISATLAYFLWRKGWFNSTKIKIVIWVLGLFIDNMPLINDLPMTVLTVLWAWHIVRQRAQEAEKNKGELHEKTLEELEVIEQETEISDDE